MTLKKSIRSPASKEAFRHSKFVWLSLTPVIIYFLIFSILPIFAAIYISLHDWPLLGGERPFIGLGNYLSIIQEARFWLIMKNTFVFAFFYVSLVLVIGLGLALLLNSLDPRARTILRPIYFAPQVTTIVAIAVMFTWAFQPRIGVVNYLLSFIGLGPYNWLTSVQLAMPTIILTAVWRSVGYSMVIFSAGLLNISRELYDAARVDGATTLDSFRYITLPMLKPTTVFVFVTTTISGFQIFIEPQLMTEGGPGTTTRVAMQEIYDRGFRFFEMGNATAFAMYLFLVIAVFSLIQMRTLRHSFDL